MAQQLNLPPLTVEDIAAPSSAPPKPDDKAIGELDTWEKARLNSYNQDADERKKYTGKIFKLEVGWLTAVGLLVAMSGLKLDITLPILRVSWGISDAVVIALIGGTTANVLGLFIIVARYLFYRAKHAPDSN